MVELNLKSRVVRENDDDTKPLYVEVPPEIVDAYSLHDGDKVDWTYSINCKNQKKTTFSKKYNGID